MGQIMKVKAFCLFSLFLLLNSCGTAIGAYLPDSGIKPDYKVNPGKTYIFGKFLEVSENRIGNLNYGDISLVLLNKDSKKEYRILLEREKPIQCFEVMPGSYIVNKYAYMAKYQAKRFNIVTNYNFRVQEGEVLYIGDYEGDSEMGYQSLGMIGYYAELLSTNKNEDGYDDLVASSGGGFVMYGKYSYTWKVKPISDNYEATKQEFLELYPQFKDLRIKNRFEAE